jgi:hypothetical protein
MARGGPGTFFHIPTLVYEKVNKCAFLFIFLWAAAGQYELSRPHFSGTLWSGIGLFTIAIFYFNRLAAGAELRNLALKPLGLKSEFIGFISIMAIAAFFRLFKLDSIPSGLSNDQAFAGYLSLEILKAHFRPLWEVGIFTHPALLLYQLAGWHFFFSPSVPAFYSFFTFISLVSFTLIYWTFRQTAGPRMALLTLYFLAIMRWHFNFTRGGFPSVQLPLYMFGTLAFLEYGFRTSRMGSFIISVIFLSIGLYSYQSFRIFPLLLLVYLAAEYWDNPQKVRENWIRLLAAFLLGSVLISPLVFHWFQIGGLGSRESESFIGKSIMEQKSLRPVLEGILKTTLMFNRSGEKHPRFNFEDHRYFDDVTGLFFVLGFFLACARWREKVYFYSITGFIAMALPGILSAQDIPFSHRMLGAAPFAAFFAASAFMVFYLKIQVMKPGARTALTLFLAFLLAVAGVENWRIYFLNQASNYETWKVYDPQDRRIGEAIVRNPGTRYFLAPGFYSNYAVRYLAYDHMGRVEVFNWLNLKDGLSGTAQKNACFVLGPGKKPTLELLKTIYPNGKETNLEDPEGNVLAHFYELALPLGPTQLKRGLMGEYYLNNIAQTTPTFRRVDPLINFTDKSDFAIDQHSAVRVNWKGKIKADISGDYLFLALTSSGGRLILDGKLVVDTSENAQGKIRLASGYHDLLLSCLPDLDPLTDVKFDLLWKKPGQEKFEVVPNSSFGLERQ